MILYCNCSYSDIIPAEKRRAIYTALQASGREVEYTADLCAAAAAGDRLLKEIAGVDDLTIIACYPRTIQWLLSYAGVSRERGAQVLNMRTQSAGEIVQSIGIEPVDPQAGEGYSAPETEWIPWYPVIDYERCTACKQCVSFCPFGVYEASGDDRVRVAHPQNCKNLCPACSRMCPGTAIIFPKHTEEPYCGAGITAETGSRSEVKSVEEALEGNDLHDILARRKAFARARKGT